MFLSYQMVITIVVCKLGINCVSCYTITDHIGSGLHHVIIVIH